MDKLFTDYYLEWIHMYKEGSVRQVTLDKYYLTHRELQKRWPLMKVKSINHYNYQKLINEYAETHEYLTVKGVIIIVKQQSWMQLKMDYL